MNTDSLRVKPKLNVETKSSSYDQVNAMLIAGLMLFGFLFSVLFLVWLTPNVDFSDGTTPPDPTTIVTGDEKPGDDEIEPGVEEFPEVKTPQLASSLAAVADTVSLVPGTLEKRSGAADAVGKGKDSDAREGPGGVDGVPEYKRWVINFSAADINAYATMLSFFKIEIGIVSASRPDVFRLNDPAGAKSVQQSSREAEKASVYFIHKKQRFRAWDKTISKQAGIDTNETLSVQFYPDDTRQLMRFAEATALNGVGKTKKDVKNTFFKVVADGAGYKFEVQEILYR